MWWLLFLVLFACSQSIAPLPTVIEDEDCIVQYDTTDGDCFIREDCSQIEITERCNNYEGGYND